MESTIPLTDAADKFGIHVSTIRRYLASGKIHRYRHPRDRRTYVSPAELAALLAPRGRLIAPDTDQGAR